MEVMKELKGICVPRCGSIGELTSAVVHTKIMVDDPTYDLRTITKEEGEELHRSTRVAKPTQRMDQSCQQDQLFQEGNDGN